MQRLVQRGGAAAPWPCPPGMPKLIHALLMQRGVSSYEEADAFLHPVPGQLIDPFRRLNIGGQRAQSLQILCRSHRQDGVHIHFC